MWHKFPIFLRNLILIYRFPILSNILQSTFAHQQEVCISIFNSWRKWFCLTAFQPKRLDSIERFLQESFARVASKTSRFFVLLFSLTRQKLSKFQTTFCIRTWNRDNIILGEAAFRKSPFTAEHHSTSDHPSHYSEIRCPSKQNTKYSSIIIRDTPPHYWTSPTILRDISPHQLKMSLQNT